MKRQLVVAFVIQDNANQGLGMNLICKLARRRQDLGNVQKNTDDECKF